MSLQISLCYRFGQFTLDTDQRTLLRDGKPLSLTPKALDTLLILVENSGRIVEREDLMNRLWPDTFVEEANLTFNIQQLRKSLGDNARRPQFVETVARRGYRFIAPVEEVLMDTKAVNDHITSRLTSTVQFPDDGEGINRAVEAQQSGPLAELGNKNQSAVPEENLRATPSSDAPSTTASKKMLALGATFTIILLGVGFLLWKFSNGASRNAGESGTRVDGKSPAALPLKLEKLTGTGQSRQVAISPDGKYVAYTRMLENRSSIWLRQLATNTNVEIVPASGFIVGLAFTNSGDSLYFVRGDPIDLSKLSPDSALYRVSLVGGVPTKITGKPEGNFSISSDDRQIAFVRQVINRDGQQQYSLIIVGSDGGNERTVLVGTYPDKLDVPVWSPGDQSIICSYGYSEGGGQDARIVEVRVDDGTRRELSPDRFFRIAKMAWLPHKSGLLMSARKNLGDNNQLWRVSYPGMEISQITEGLASYMDLSYAANADTAVASQATRISDIWVGSSSDPHNLKRVTPAIDNFCWMPNGRLVYSSAVSGNSDLWVMQPDGSEQKQITVDPAVDRAPVGTPDNRYVVFISNRSGASQVWRMNIDGSNQLQLTNGAGKDHPAVSPDGKWILYNTTDDWHLWKVPIGGGDPVRLTDHITYRPSISPDGNMIACFGRSEAKSELLILPFAGGQPLKRFILTVWDTRSQWTPDGKALIYAAKGNRRASLMRQSLNGSPPEEIAHLEEEELYDFGYSVDNQFLAVTRGVWQHDIVLISDINRY
jgi:Tol biopolymer transport system component/DNA-binding winged helix-turn-helix (wHTH) protein